MAEQYFDTIEALEAAVNSDIGAAVAADATPYVTDLGLYVTVEQDEEVAGDYALTGLRVADFTQAWAGPLCTQILGDFGADIIKIESSTRLDVARMMGPFPGAESDADASGYFMELNRNKRSIALNLREPEDVEIARELVATVDVVVENFAPGVMDRLGLGYDVLREGHPGLVMLSISGFGATGPDRSAVAFGQQIEAESGLMSVTGYGDGPPLKPGVSYPDPVAGIAGAGAVMAALLHRDRSGQGQWIDLSMLETTVSLLVEPLLRYSATGTIPHSLGNASRYWAPHGIYPASGEDRWIAIECCGEEQWRRLVDVLGDATLATDPRWSSNELRLAQRDQLDGLLGELTVARDPDELATELQTAGVAAALVADAADLANDVQLRARNWWQEIDDASFGRLEVPGPLARLSETLPSMRRSPPRLGEHTDEVLAELRVA
jgi:crotonobetainyl-CoA:carnitine CoA-transferase CaiB-like acyl-CoA transferase